MKRLVLLLLVVFVGGTLSAQEGVEIKEGTPFWYVCLEFQGSHYEIPQKIGPFIAELRKQELLPKITGHLFGIYFDSPLRADCADTVWGLGFNIAEDAEVKPPLLKRQYDYEKIATTIHVGPYETVGNSYNLLIPLIEENHLDVAGPPIERWLDDDPQQVAPEERRTEIIIPVRVIE